MHPRIGGTWLNTVAPWGDASWSHGEHGCKEASFSVSLPKGTRHPALAGRPLVEIMDGSAVAWSGQMAEQDWTEGRFTAQGLAYGAARFEALDGSGNLTSRPDVAIDQSIARGWQVTRGSGVPTTAHGGTMDSTVKVAALLDSNADELGQWWTVRADRVVRFAAAPTTPMWHLVPGVVDLGNADDEYASTIMVRYLDSGTSTYKTAARSDTAAAARFGTVEYPLDVTWLGPITTAKANSIGDGILAKGRSRLGWVSGIEVTGNELLTPGGVPASLSMVESHQLMRIHGIYDDLAFLAGRTYLDAVIGETSYVDGSDVITLSPLGSVAQTFAEVIEALGNKAA